jgi:hypothetical protein
MEICLPVDRFLDRAFERECELPGESVQHFFGEEGVQFELRVRVGDEILIPDAIRSGAPPREVNDAFSAPRQVSMAELFAGNL